MSSLSLSAIESVLRIAVAVPVSVATLPIGSSVAAGVAEAAAGARAGGGGGGGAGGGGGGGGGGGRRRGGWLRLGELQSPRLYLLTRNQRVVIERESHRILLRRAAQHDKAEQRMRLKPPKRSHNEAPQKSSKRSGFQPRRTECRMNMSWDATSQLPPFILLPLGRARWD
jgi:hypothetical protein